MNKKISKQEKVYESIKQLIIHNELAPGTQLSEQELCEKLGVSRTPVREAIYKLENNNFVEYIKGKGAFVSSIGMEVMLQYYEIREALEGLAAKLCALRGTEKDIIEFENLLNEIKQYAKAKDYPKAMDSDMKFHRYLIKASHNAQLEPIMSNILDQINRVAYQARDNEIVSQSIEDHQKILEAIKNANASEAENLIKMHISHSKNYNFKKLYGLYL